MAYSREQTTGILVLRDNKRKGFTTLIGNRGAIVFMPEEFLEPWLESADRYTKIGCYYIPDKKIEKFCESLYSLRSNTNPALKMGLKALEAGLNNF